MSAWSEGTSWFRKQNRMYRFLYSSETVPANCSHLEQSVELIRSKEPYKVMFEMWSLYEMLRALRSRSCKSHQVNVLVQL